MSALKYDLIVIGFRTRWAARRRGRIQDEQARGGGRGSLGGGRRVHQHWHHPIKDHARGGSAPVGL